MEIVYYVEKYGSLIILREDYDVDEMVKKEILECIKRSISGGYKDNVADTIEIDWQETTKKLVQENL